MNLKTVANFLKDNDLPAYRVKQIRQAVYKEGVLSFSEIKTIPKELRERLDKELGVLSLDPAEEYTNSDGQSAKCIFLTKDALKISSVLIAPKPGIWTACLSSQVGCPLNCGFCATGASGFKRDLSRAEICDQVLYWNNYLKDKNEKLSNIVFMGMGEPFLNWENVKIAIEDLLDGEMFGMSARSISVSTVGIPDKMKIFSKTFPQVNLALSLHSANDAIRSRIVPVNKTHGLSSLFKALDEHINRTNRKVFIEYLMLKGRNDTLDDAEDLIRFVKKLKKPSLAHVNLIPYNETEKGFRSSDSRTIKAFRDKLVKERINVTIRKSLGGDIEAACGQLRTNKTTK